MRIGRKSCSIFKLAINSNNLLVYEACVFAILVNLPCLTQAQLVISPVGPIQAVTGKQLLVNCTAASPQINPDTVYWNVQHSSNILQQRIAAATWLLKIIEYTVSDGSVFECCAKTYNGSSVQSKVTVLPVRECSVQTQFLCSTGECIGSSQKCDGFAQCRDASDEVGCQTINATVRSPLPIVQSTVAAQTAMSSSNKMSDGSVIGLVVGVVVGIVVILVVLLVVCLLRRKRLGGKPQKFFCLRLCEGEGESKPSSRGNKDAPANGQTTSRSEEQPRPSSKQTPSKPRSKSTRQQARYPSSRDADRRRHPQSHPPYGHAQPYPAHPQYHHPYQYHYPYQYPQQYPRAPVPAQNQSAQAHIYENWQPPRPAAPPAYPNPSWYSAEKNGNPTQPQPRPPQPQVDQSSFGFPPYFAKQNAQRAQLRPSAAASFSQHAAPSGAKVTPSHSYPQQSNYRPKDKSALPGATTHEDVVTMRRKRRSHSRHSKNDAVHAKHHNEQNRLRIESHIKSITEDHAFISAAAPFTHFDDVSPRRRIVPSSVGSRASRLSTASRGSRPVEWGIYLPFVHNITINDSVFDVPGVEQTNANANANANEPATSMYSLCEEDRAIQAELDEHARHISRVREQNEQKPDETQQLLTTVNDSDEEHTESESEACSDHDYVNLAELNLDVDELQTRTDLYNGDSENERPLQVDTDTEPNGFEPPTSGSPLPPYSSLDPIAIGEIGNHNQPSLRPHQLALSIDAPNVSSDPPVTVTLSTRRPLLLSKAQPAALNVNDQLAASNSVHSDSDQTASISGQRRTDNNELMATNAPQRGNSFRFFESAM